VLNLKSHPSFSAATAVVISFWLDAGVCRRPELRL
jgi:hypothetical protein